LTASVEFYLVIRCLYPPITADEATTSVRVEIAAAWGSGKSSRWQTVADGGVMEQDRQISAAGAVGGGRLSARPSGGGG
jgi:hypothetical protein